MSYHGVPTAPFVLARSPADARQRPAPVPALREAGLRGLGQGRERPEPLHERGASWCRQVSQLLATYAEPVLIETYLPGPRVHRRRARQRRRGALPADRRHATSTRCPRARRRSTATRPSGSGTRRRNPLEIFECPARIPEVAGRGRPRRRAGAYHALDCRDWCRIDVRCDAAGRPMVVELNPLPGILPDPRDNSCFPKAARAAGMSYDELIRTVADIAWRRISGRSLLAEVALMKIAILFDAGSDEWSPQDVAAVVAQRPRGARRPPAAGARGRAAARSAWATSAGSRRVRRADLVFNLCEGINGHARYEDLVVGTLELTGVPFTGCRPGPPRSATGSTSPTPCSSAAGLPVPAFTLAQANKTPAELPLPAIVKPAAEDASVGIDNGAVCTTQARAQEAGRPDARAVRRGAGPGVRRRPRVQRRLRRQADAARSPRSGSTSMPDGQLAHRELRRQVDPREPGGRGHQPVCPAELAAELATRLGAGGPRRPGSTWPAARATAGWTSGSARTGQPYVLEVNPYPDLSSNAGPGPDGPRLRLELRRPGACRSWTRRSLRSAEPSAPPRPWSAGCPPRERHARLAAAPRPHARPTAAASRRSPVRSGSSARTRSRSRSRSSTARSAGIRPTTVAARRRAGRRAWPAGSAGARRPARSAPTISTGWRWIPRCQGAGIGTALLREMERRLAGRRPADRRGDGRPARTTRRPAASTRRADTGAGRASRTSMPRATIRSCT